MRDLDRIEPLDREQMAVRVGQLRYSRVQPDVTLGDAPRQAAEAGGTRA
ncbi:MAG: hypothetical protein ACREFT_17335 [Acetobacteraceae bacterium]